MCVVVTAVSGPVETLCPSCRLSVVTAVNELAEDIVPVMYFTVTAVNGPVETLCPSCRLSVVTAVNGPAETLCP